MSLDTDPGDQLLPAAADLPPYGDDHAPDAAAPRRRVPRKRPSQRRFWLRRVAVLTLLLAFAGTGWLAVSAVIARRALLRAQAGTALLRHDLTTGDVTAAAARLAAVHRDAHRAHVLTTSVVWRIAGRVPVAGETPRTVRGLAYEADVLSARVLPHFVTIARTASGGGLRNGDRIDVGALRTMNAELTTLSTELDGVVRRTQALPSGSLLTPVAAGRQQLITDTSALARTVAQLRDATSIAPGMLGADGPRRYFVALETNAELRGSGGLIGAYAVMEVDNGQIRLTQLGSNKELRDTYPQPTPGLDPGFSAQYERFGADGFWLNSNMSADFPTVNRIWSSMYERTTGQHVDGSIAVDPIALAQILKATGPATTPSGESVGADNIVPLTEQQIYARFPAFAQDAVRNDLQLQIARSLYGRLVAPVSHDVGLLPQLGAAAASGHIRIASNHPGEQAVLVRGAVGGALPATDGPYLQVAVNNAGGTKLDYYLKPSISYAFETAYADHQDVSLTLKLRSAAPAGGLPEYVVIRPDQPGNKALTPGQNRLYVSVYGGRGATLRGAGIDGVPLVLDAGSEQGHPVWSAFVTIDPGQERTLVLALTERGTDQHVTVVPPATVTPATVEILGGSAR